MKQNTVEIACAVNAAYLPHAATMVASLFESNPREAFRIHLFLDADVDEADQEVMVGFVSGAGHQIECRAAAAHVPVGVPISKRFSAAAWFRVLLADLLPDVSRVLYLDVDLLVLEPIRELWETPLEDALAAAVTNPLYPGMDEQPIFALGLNRLSDYFNSGVLLLDLEAMRKCDIASKVFELARERPEITRYADQEPLNAVLAGHVLFVSPKWNVQNSFYDLSCKRLSAQGYPKESVLRLRDRPAVIHYSGPWKPWQARCPHPKRGLYQQYREQTPWRRWHLEQNSRLDPFIAMVPGRWLVAWLLLKLRFRN